MALVPNAGPEETLAKVFAFAKDGLNDVGAFFNRRHELELASERIRIGELKAAKGEDIGSTNDAQATQSQEQIQTQASIANNSKLIRNSIIGVLSVGAFLLILKTIKKK